MRLYPHPPRLYTIHFTLYTKKQIFEFMKKSYIAPQTEAIELLGANAIMAASPGGTGNFNMMYGSGDGGGMR